MWYGKDREFLLFWGWAFVSFDNSVTLLQQILKRKVLAQDFKQRLVRRESNFSYFAVERERDVGLLLSCFRHYLEQKAFLLHRD